MPGIKRITTLTYLPIFDRLLCGHERVVALVNPASYNVEIIVDVKQHVNRFIRRLDEKFVLAGGNVLKLPSLEIIAEINHMESAYFENDNNLIVIVSSFYDDESNFTTLDVYRSSTYDKMKSDELYKYCRKFGHSIMGKGHPGHISADCIQNFTPIDEGRYILQSGICGYVVGYEHWRSRKPPIDEPLIGLNPYQLSITKDERFVASANKSHIRIWDISTKSAGGYYLIDSFDVTLFCNDTKIDGIVGISEDQKKILKDCGAKFK